MATICFDATSTPHCLQQLACRHSVHFRLVWQPFLLWLLSIIRRGTVKKTSSRDENIALYQAEKAIAHNIAEYTGQYKSQNLFFSLH